MGNERRIDVPEYSGCGRQHPVRPVPALRRPVLPLDATTGQVLWLGPSRAAENTAVAKAGSLLFLLNDDAELIVARRNRSQFEPLRRYSVADSATWAQPAISGKRLFVKDVDSLALWTLD